MDLRFGGMVVLGQREDSQILPVWHAPTFPTLGLVPLTPVPRLLPVLAPEWGFAPPTLTLSLVTAQDALFFGQGKWFPNHCL